MRLRAINQSSHFPQESEFHPQIPYWSGVSHIPRDSVAHLPINPQYNPSISHTAFPNYDINGKNYVMADRMSSKTQFAQWGITPPSDQAVQKVRENFGFVTNEQLIMWKARETELLEEKSVSFCCCRNGCATIWFL